MINDVGCSGSGADSQTSFASWYAGFSPLRTNDGGYDDLAPCDFTGHTYKEASESFETFLSEWINGKGKDADECIAVGLCGSWGSGKTSFLQTVLDKLRKDQEAYERDGDKVSSGGGYRPRKLHIIEFDSWMAAGELELANQLMDKLEASMGWGLRRSFRRFRRALGGMNISASLKWPLGVADFSLSASPNKDGEARDALSRRKRALNEKMGPSGRWIVVVDNLDRLPEPRIQFVFQLIGSILDLQSTLFVLCFDRKVVAKALDGISCGEGERYLDKVCPVCVELPPVDTQRLIANLFNLDRRSRLAAGYRHLFETPRYARQVKAMLEADRAIGASRSALCTDANSDANAVVLGTFVHDRWPGIYAYLNIDSRRVSEIERCVADYSPVGMRGRFGATAQFQGPKAFGDGKYDGVTKNPAIRPDEDLVNKEIAFSDDDRTSVQKGLRRDEDPLRPFRRLLDWAEGDKSLEGRFIPSADLDNLLNERGSWDSDAGLAGFDDARRDTLNLWRVFELLPLCCSMGGREGVDSEVVKTRGPLLGDVIAGDHPPLGSGPYGDVSPFSAGTGARP